MGGRRLPDLVECGNESCGDSFKPRMSTSKYCSQKCQCEARRKKKVVVAEKRCSKCKTVRPVSEFHKNKKCADGCQSWCKSCNRSRHRKSEFTYYQCERCSQSFRRKKKSPKAEKDRSKRCGDCARADVIAANGGHSVNYTGSDFFAGGMMAQWKFSAKRRGHSWHLTKDELDAKFRSQAGKCALSGLEMEFRKTSPYRPSIDRIDSSVGYQSDNFQFVCSVVNVMKNKIDEDEFVRLCSLIATNRETVLQE